MKIVGQVENHLLIAKHAKLFRCSQYTRKLVSEPLRYMCYDKGLVLVLEIGMSPWKTREQPACLNDLIAGIAKIPTADRPSPPHLYPSFPLPQPITSVQHLRAGTSGYSDPVTTKATPRNTTSNGERVRRQAHRVGRSREVAPPPLWSTHIQPPSELGWHTRLLISNEKSDNPSHLREDRMRSF